MLGYKVLNLTTNANQIALSSKPKRESQNKRSKKPLSDDARKQLYNDGKVGAIEKIQVSTECIVKLNGVLLDLDPSLLKKGSLIPNFSADPDQFFEQCVRPWLTRHPVLDALEIRMSGTGLHGILWLDPVVEFVEDSERDRWCSIVQIIQAVLPTDPHAPGLTATTRARGSKNTKSGKKVTQLKKGGAVSPASAIELQRQMCASPFKMLFGILTGSDRLSPCPFCNTEKSTLSALDFVGRCYECGNVTFDKLCAQLYQSKTTGRG